jgi:hypothetical protein
MVLKKAPYSVPSGKPLERADIAAIARGRHNSMRDANDQNKSPPRCKFRLGSWFGGGINNNSYVGPSSSSASHYYSAAEGGARQY